MSYFITSAGTQIKLPPNASFKLTPLKDAQKYLQKLAPTLTIIDGSPLFFVDDLKTGTSHDIVCDAQIALNQGGKFSETLLHSILKMLLESGHIIRIWYADDTADAHLRLDEYQSLAAAESCFAKQALQTIRIRISPRE